MLEAFILILIIAATLFVLWFTKKHGLTLKSGG